MRWKAHLVVLLAIGLAREAHVGNNRGGDLDAEHPSATPARRSMYGHGFCNEGLLARLIAELKSG